jgi:hypothetical protein
MKKIIGLLFVGVLSLVLAAPVLADNQHDRRSGGPHVQRARFEHFRSFRGASVQTYYYPYPSYVYYPYPVYYPEVGAEESPEVDAAPEVQREVVFSTGKYVLQSDGGDAYRWVWIPAVPDAPPVAAPPLVSPAPSVADPAPSAPPQRIYHWTDEHGVAYWTNNAETVPAKYRSPANSDRPS